MRKRKMAQRRGQATARYILAWREYRNTSQHLREQDGDGYAEAWRQHRAVLTATWEDCMLELLPPNAGIAFRLLLERTRDLRDMWTVRGGYLFTRAGNPRKRRRDDLKPRIPVNVRDRLRRAQSTFVHALAVASSDEHLDYATVLPIILAGLSGSITGPARMTGWRRFSLIPLWPRINWPWHRGLSRRIRAMRESPAGWVSAEADFSRFS